MDAETGTKATKPSAAACGGPVLKMVMVGSLMGSAGLLGVLLALHFSGHLSSSPTQGQASEQASSAMSQAGPVMVSGANQVNEVSKTRGQGSSVGTALAALAMAAGDVGDAITDVAGDVQDMIDQAADTGDTPLMNDGLDLSDSMSDPVEAGGEGLGDGMGDGLMGDSSSIEDVMGGGGGEAFGGAGDSMEDLSGKMLGGLGESLGDAGEALGESSESLEKSSESLEEGLLGDGLIEFGDGLGESSESLEDGLGGDGPVMFGDGMGDLGVGFGDLDDSLGAGLVMSSLFNNNNNNNNNARRSRQNAQGPPGRQNLNPFGLLLMTGDGFGFD